MARQTIAVSALLDAAGIRKGVDESNRHLGRLSKGATSLSRLLKGALAGAAITAGFRAVVTEASDAQQSVGATEAVYGKYANSVIRSSKKAADAVGLSSNEYRELSNVMGAMLKNSGTPLKGLAKQSDQLVRLGGDLAATYGGTTKEAVEALSSLLRGEADPIERYGVSIKQSDVNARLAAKGQDKLTGAARKQAEQMARLKLLNEQTTDAQGQFSRESSTYAGQLQRASAQWDNLKAAIGTRALPVLTKALTYINTKGPAVVSQLRGGAAVIRQFFDRFTSGSGQASEKFAQIQTTVTSVWASIKSTFTSGVQIVQSLWGTFGATITSYLSNTLTNTLTLLRGAFTVIRGIFQTFSAVLRGDWSAAWSGVKTIVSGAFTIVRAVVAQALNIIRSLARAGLAALRGIVSGAMSGVRAAFAAGWNGARSLAASAWASIRSTVSSGASRVVGFVKGLPGKIKGAFGDAKSILSGVGRDIMRGLTAGIADAGRAAVQKAKDIAGDVKGAVTGFFKIKSPSRLMRTIGRFIGKGMELGLTDSTASILKAVRRQGVNTKKEYLKQARDLSRTLYANAKARYTQLRDQARAYSVEVRDAAKSYASLTNLGTDQPVTGASINQFLTSRLDAIRDFRDKLKGLKGKISSDLYRQIVGMGVEQGGAFATALAGTSPEALKELNALNSAIGKESAALGTQTSAAMYKSGVDAARGFLAGMKSLTSQISKAGSGMGKALVKALKKALGINSPSRVLAQLGRYSVDGLRLGLDPAVVSRQGARLSRALVQGFERPQLSADVSRAGFRVGATVNHFKVYVSLDASMSEAQMGRAYKRAIKAAESLGIA
ncbi:MULTISPECIES: hypothetical protein [unclassified Aeromicrobium]|uniref:phage tail protein n=1 Tax=unclassified Aeromicrobium TaxID=2633570 RepID=UPI00288A1D29|nr:MULTISPECIES: hypothetical protein [unclassified Aeromicrobium]